jgi:kynurenine formamidase
VEEAKRGAVEVYEPIHKTMLGNNIISIEQLMNLDKIKGQRVIASFFPLAVKGLDGCPVRAVAFVD